VSSSCSCSLVYSLSLSLTLTHAHTHTHTHTHLGAKAVSDVADGERADGVSDGAEGEAVSGEEAVKEVTDEVANGVDSNAVGQSVREISLIDIKTSDVNMFI